MIERLDLTEAERRSFLASAAGGIAALPVANDEVLHVDADRFALIADTHHYEILELTRVPEYRPDPRWISRELGISPLQAKHAQERLIRMGLLIRKNGRWTKAQERIETGDRDRTTAALRRHQAQVLEQARASLENDPFEERVLRSLTLAIDPELLPVACEKIQEFMDALCRLLGSKRQRRVYHLGVQLFPAQRTRKTIPFKGETP